MKKKVIISFILVFITIINYSAPVNAVIRGISDEDSNNGVDYESIAEPTGNLMIGLLALGSIFIITKRTFIISNKYLNEELYPDAKKNIRKFYISFRKPLLMLHIASMATATAVSFIHGFFLFSEGGLRALFGFLSAVSMLTMTISGFIMWRRIKPLWSHETPKNLIRWVHRQWIIAGILVVSLFFHLAVFGD